jgi:hypothetical protein
LILDRPWPRPVRVADGLEASGFAAELLAVLPADVLTGDEDVWLTCALGAEGDEADALLVPAWAGRASARAT